MLHIRVECNLEFVISPALPSIAETALKDLLKRENPEDVGIIDEPSLARTGIDEASGETIVSEEGGIDIVAGAGTALELLVDGLQRRLQNPVLENEKLRLVGVRR